jgi:hypothetical protein
MSGAIWFRKCSFLMYKRGRKPKAMTFTFDSLHRFPKFRSCWRNGNFHRLS